MKGSEATKRFSTSPQTVKAVSSAQLTQDAQTLTTLRAHFNAGSIISVHLTAVDAKRCSHVEVILWQHVRKRVNGIHGVLISVVL
jgi:hypothetical protein